MLTWSLGWAPSPARLASTSLAFMFEEVPEPVWKTSTGNWSSCSPAATASPAAAIRSARSASSRPSSPLACAAAALSRPSQRTTGTGTRSPETGKLSTALVVSPPQSCSVKVVASIEVVSRKRISRAVRRTSPRGRRRATVKGMRRGMARRGIAAGSAALLCTLAFAAFAAAQPISLEVGNLTLSFSATVRPKALPRSPRAPVSLSLSSRFATKDGSQPPPISGATIDIDRAVAVDTGGVPSCTAAQLENQTTEAVEAACGGAIVGSGSARIEIAQPGGAPFLAESRLLAVNGGSAGRTTTVLIHAYLTSPTPETIVVPVTLTRLPKGSFGLRARVAVPAIAGGAGSLASFDLTFAKRIYSDGEEARLPDGEVHRQQRRLRIGSDVRRRQFRARHPRPALFSRRVARSAAREPGVEALAVGALEVCAENRAARAVRAAVVSRRISSAWMPSSVRPPAGRRRAGSRAAGSPSPPGSARASALSLVAAATIASPTVARSPACWFSARHSLIGVSPPASPRPAPPRSALR